MALRSQDDCQYLQKICIMRKALYFPNWKARSQFGCVSSPARSDAHKSASLIISTISSQMHVSKCLAKI